MKRAALYLGLPMAGLGLILGAVPAAAQNAIPDGTPTRTCLYALKSGEPASLPAPSGPAGSAADFCDKQGEGKFGKGNYQVKGRQCVWPGGETGDADNTTDYTNACKTSWTLGE